MRRRLTVTHSTGLRNYSGEVSVAVDGIHAPFSGPAAQSQFDGLDQLNIGPLPLSFGGRGEVESVVKIDGKQASAAMAASSEKTASGAPPRSSRLRAGTVTKRDSPQQLAVTDHQDVAVLDDVVLALQP